MGIGAVSSLSELATSTPLAICENLGFIQFANKEEVEWLTAQDRNGGVQIPDICRGKSLQRLSNVELAGKLICTAASMPSRILAAISRVSISFKIAHFL